MNSNLSISQNFFVNLDYVEKLIDGADIDSNDTVIDIGAGKGIITELLSKRAKEVIAIEYDHKLFLKLKNKFANTPNVKVLNEDFLRYDLPKFKYKIFANPPFNLSADIINKLLNIPNTMIDAYLVLQDKTVERFSTDENQTSTLWKPFYEISILQKIDRKEFRPIPNVNIVLCKFKKLDNPLVDINNYQMYRDFVTYGYNQWKPTVLKAFNKVFTSEQLNRISKTYNLDNLKPSELSVNHWLALFESFINVVSKEKQAVVIGYEHTHHLKQKNMVKRNKTTK